MRGAAALIVGATSPIARAAAATWAAQGYRLTLAGRDLNELERIAADLSIRYGSHVDTVRFDITAIESCGPFFSESDATAGGFSVLLIAAGHLGNAIAANSDFTAAEAIIRCNYLGPCALLTTAANAFAKRKGGTLITISSVAGDRGRKSNYIYGSAKGGLALFLEGLQTRLHPYGVGVVTIKPGFVDTAMTYGMEGLFSVASPERVGRRIAATAGGSGTRYIPWFWRVIMMIIRTIPPPLFKRIKL